MMDSRSTIECPAAIDEVGSTTMRIGILKADETPDALIDVHGRYEEFYIKLLAPYHFDFTVYPVLQGTFPSSIDEANGWLITGSRRSVWENEPWILRLKELVREVSGSRVPLVGICFGHQVIASALGGKVERSKEGWIVGPTAYRRASTGKIQNVLVWHQDQITVCPPGAEVLAWSSSCENAILQYGETMRTFQCHPELTPAFMKDLLPLYAEELHPARRPEILNASEEALQGLELGEEIAAFFKRFSRR
jgi:GMP synthase-like glutamine amidotransferase